METKNKNKNKGKEIFKSIGSDFIERFWDESWTYIKTVVDVVREPVLILDKEFKVIAGNESFYRFFQVDAKDTDGEVVYELGNGQWNIPALKRLLETILPENTFFKGFEVDHEFPFIGHKVMILNARHIHYKGESNSKLLPAIILLAIEDITEMTSVADRLAQHTLKFETESEEQAKVMNERILALESEISELTKKGQ